MRRKTRNITGRNVTSSGTRLNSGLDTITTFDLATSAPVQLSEKVRMRFTPSQSGVNDYLSVDTHISQFTQTAGAVLVDGGSYANKFIAKNAQFIAPQEGYVKSVQGYIVATGSSGCEDESVTISMWSKTADASGTSTTPMNLIFSQTLTFISPSNQFVLAIDSKLYGTYNNITMSEGEGVIFSIKRNAKVGEPCLTCAASMTMIFESTNNYTEEFMFPSLSGSNNRINETISNPDENYRFLGDTAKKISE